jgi:hypothetical protein
MEIEQVAPMTMRDKIFALEDEMRRLPQLEIPVRHYFSDGVYAREITIPKGAVVTGKIHKYRQLNILSAGELSVWIEEGVIERVKAPFTTVSPPGTKRIAYAHDISVWTTILATEETEPDKIEAHFIAPTEKDYLQFCEQLRLGHSCHS